MKVFGRILAKLVILALVITLCAGGAVAWRGYKQATPEYTINRYLTYIIEGNNDRAYPMLDETGGLRLSREAFDQATEAKKYSVCSSFEVRPEGEAQTELASGETEQAQAQADVVKKADDTAVFTVVFTDASGQNRITEDITLKKMENLKYGLFADWRIDPDHVMVHDYSITVPSGSILTIGSEAASGQWLVENDGDPSSDTYHIPVIMPQTVGITVRHPVLESVNTSVDTTGDPVNFTDRMPMKAEAVDQAKELGVAIIKNLLTASVKEDSTVLNIYVDQCRNEAETFMKDESKVLHADDSRNFLSIAASGFAEQLGDLSYDENGNVQLPMSLSYQYTIRYEAEVESWLYFNDDGTPQITTETQTETGVSTAEMMLTWMDGGWTLTQLSVPTTGEVPQPAAEPETTAEDQAEETTAEDQAAG